MKMGSYPDTSGERRGIRSYDGVLAGHIQADNFGGLLKGVESTPGTRVGTAHKPVRQGSERRIPRYNLGDGWIDLGGMQESEQPRGEASGS